MACGRVSEKLVRTIAVPPGSPGHPQQLTGLGKTHTKAIFRG